MDRNLIEERWRQCHWEQWRKIRARWIELLKAREAHNRQSEKCRAAAFELRHHRVPSVGHESVSAAFGSWSGGHAVSTIFPAERRAVGFLGRN